MTAKVFHLKESMWPSAAIEHHVFHQHVLQLTLIRHLFISLKFIFYYLLIVVNVRAECCRRRSGKNNLKNVRNGVLCQKLSSVEVTQARASVIKNLLSGSVTFIHGLTLFHLICPARPNLNLMKPGRKKIKVSSQAQVLSKKS